MGDIEIQDEDAKTVGWSVDLLIFMMIINEKYSPRVLMTLR